MPPILIHLPTQAPSHPQQDTGYPLGQIHALTDLCVFQATGIDAISFLQGQITNDIAGATSAQSRLAGYCTAQGRLLATMILNTPTVSTGQDPVVLGLIRQDLTASVLKRLNMFVLRAKVKLAPSELKVYGVKTTNEQLPGLQKLLGTSLPTATWETIHSESGMWICAPSVKGLRWWWVATETQLNSHQRLIDACESRPTDEWNAQDIESGLPWIDSTVQDLFIPQTVNLDLINGVSFTKGCYPGQEIVARSHYRGTLKKRMARGHVEGATELKPGVDIFDNRQPDQPCGRIINIAHSANVTSLLFEITFEAMDHNVIRAGSPEGLQIALDTLPYELQPSKS